MGLATESAGVLGDDWPGRGWAWRQSQRESSVMTGRTWMGLAGARACEGGWLSGQSSLRTHADALERVDGCADRAAGRVWSQIRSGESSRSTVSLPANVGSSHVYQGSFPLPSPDIFEPRAGVRGVKGGIPKGHER